MEKHNYGLNEHVIQYTPWSGDSIRVEKPYKKVILVNVEDCKDRITVNHVRARLMGMGWFEWEDLLSNLLVEAVVDALNQGRKEADVTKLFACELIGEDRLGKWTKPQYMVESFLMGRLFECMEENEERMYIRIIEKSISD